MKIHLIGCDHNVQSEPCPVGWEEKQSKYREKIASIIHTASPGFIGEEVAYHKHSIAESLAASRRISYANIDLLPSVRAGIRHVQWGTVKAESGMNPPPQWETAPRNIKCKYEIAWNRVREYHMFQTFCDHIEGVSLNQFASVPALLVCGSIHLKGLERLLRHQRFEVERTE
jgi:hypothetical protein